MIKRLSFLLIIVLILSFFGCEMPEDEITPPTDSEVLEAYTAYSLAYLDVAILILSAETIHTSEVTADGQVETYENPSGTLKYVSITADDSSSINTITFTAYEETVYGYFFTGDIVYTETSADPAFTTTSGELACTGGVVSLLTIDISGTYTFSGTITGDGTIINI